MQLKAANGYKCVQSSAVFQFIYCAIKRADVDKMDVRATSFNSFTVQLKAKNGQTSFNGR